MPFTTLAKSLNMASIRPEHVGLCLEWMVVVLVDGFRSWPQVKHVVTLLGSGEEVVLDTPSYEWQPPWQLSLNSHHHNKHQHHHHHIDHKGPFSLIEVKRGVNEGFRELNNSLLKIFLEVPANSCHQHHYILSILNHWHTKIFKITIRSLRRRSYAGCYPQTGRSTSRCCAGWTEGAPKCVSESYRCLPGKLFYVDNKLWTPHSSRFQVATWPWSKAHQRAPTERNVGVYFMESFCWNCSSAEIPKLYRSIPILMTKIVVKMHIFVPRHTLHHII